MAGTAVEPVGVDERFADRLVSVEAGEGAGQVWRWPVSVQISRIDFNFGPELGSAGYLDQDRVLDHYGTVAWADGEVEPGMLAVWRAGAERTERRCANPEGAPFSVGRSVSGSS